MWKKPHWAATSCTVAAPPLRSLRRQAFMRTAFKKSAGESPTTAWKWFCSVRRVRCSSAHRSSTEIV
tara:strand:- start:107 stop:307 length:201 start_codon:yes stop_codon:yes gene_type:complete